MRLIIDTMAQATGWTPIIGGSIIGLNTHDDYIAGRQPASLMFRLPAIGDGIEKTYTAVDVRKYTELRFSIYSQGFVQTDYNTKAGYGLKMIINGTDTYYVPLWGTFTAVNFDIEDLTQITSIRFESVSHEDHNLEVVISEIQVTLDEFPLDILISIDDQLGVMATPIQTKYPVGVVTANVGDKIIAIRDNGNPTNLQYLDRYMLISIGGEIHGIQSKKPLAGGTIELTLTQYFDGPSIRHAVVDEVVYIHVDVTFGRKDDSILSIPSFTAWGFTPENYKISTDIEMVVDSLKDDDTFRIRQVGEYFEYIVLLDCESRSTEILAEMSTLARKFISQKILWINGLKCQIDFNGIANEIAPDTHYEIIPKIQYPITVKIREEIWERTIAHKVTTTSVTVTTE